MVELRANTKLQKKNKKKRRLSDLNCSYWSRFFFLSPTAYSFSERKWECQAGVRQDGREEV